MQESCHFEEKKRCWREEEGHGHTERPSNGAFTAFIFVTIRMHISSMPECYFRWKLPYRGCTTNLLERLLLHQQSTSFADECAPNDTSKQNTVARLAWPRGRPGERSEDGTLGGFARPWNATERTEATCASWLARVNRELNRATELVLRHRRNRPERDRVCPSSTRFIHSIKQKSQQATH